MKELIDRQAAIDAPRGADGDCISRRGLTESLLSEDYEKHDYCFPCKEILTRINTQPFIQPERKTGEWVKISPAGIYECSECGKNVMTADIEAYDFCHGCGAKMEVEHG